jgi:hypothetical protein
MGRRLVAAVHVRHPVTHEPLVLRPGEEPDEDLAAIITNPDCWRPDDRASVPAEETATEPEKPTVRRRAAKKDHTGE